MQPGKLRAPGFGGGNFDPATLNPTGWWRTPYAGAPWANLGSVGGSLGASAAPGGALTVGANLNGRATADGNGSRGMRGGAGRFVEQYVSLFGSVSSPPGPGSSIGILFNARTATPDVPANPYDMPGLFATNAGGYVIAAFSTAGFVAAVYDGAYRRVAAAAPTGAWTYAQLRYDGALLQARVNGGAWSSIAAAMPGTPGDLTYFPLVGVNYAELAGIDGQVADVFVTKTVLSDGDFNNLRGYCANYHGVSV